MRFKKYSRIAVLASTLFAAGAAAQGYPAKPVRVVVTFGAGSAGDTLSRIVGKHLSDALGQQFLVDNRPGANGLVGTLTATTAPADGYTLLFSNGGVVINPMLLRKPPYDVAADLVPITIAATIPFVLAAHPSLPVTSVKGLIAFAKARPGEVNYATGGSAQRVAMEMFTGAASIKLTHVSYKGTGQAFSDVLAGQVPIMFSGVANAVPYAKSDRLRLLAVSSASRSIALPDVPTMAEAALPGYHYVVWLGYLARSGTPGDVIARLHAEVVRIIRLNEVRQDFARFGFEAMGNTPEEFAALIRNERVQVAKFVRDAGIALQ